MPATALIDDALSAAFAQMKLSHVASGAFDAGGDWALAFPAAEGFKLHLITAGEAWLSVAGSRKRLRLQAGDCALIADGRASTLSGTAVPHAPLPLSAVKGDAQSGVVRLGRGGDCFSLGVHFGFDGPLSGPMPGLLFAKLPPVIHVDGRGAEAALLHAHVRQFRDEYVQRGVGRSFLLHHLAPIVLLHIVRLYLGAHPPGRNWLIALSDRRLSRVFDAIHARCGEPWSVESLAQHAGMSRSGFALRFKQVAGVAPMDYLASWRIQTAGALLREQDNAIAEVAAAVGYASASAFSTAFTKALGCRPGAYRARVSQQRSSGTGFVA